MMARDEILSLKMGKGLDWPEAFGRQIDRVEGPWRKKEWSKMEGGRGCVIFMAMALPQLFPWFASSPFHLGIEDSKWRKAKGTILIELKFCILFLYYFIYMLKYALWFIELLNSLLYIRIIRSHEPIRSLIVDLFSRPRKLPMREMWSNIFISLSRWQLAGTNLNKTISVVSTGTKCLDFGRSSYFGWLYRLVIYWDMEENNWSSASYLPWDRGFIFRIEIVMNRTRFYL